MSHTCLALAAFAALIASAAPAFAAGPVTRQCDYRGEGKLGPLVVAYDESAHLVRVTSADGRLWLYQDGAIGRLGPAIAAADDPGPVQQFVIERAGQVEVGFRWPDDGTTGHLAHFDAGGVQESGEALRLALALGLRDGLKRPAERPAIPHMPPVGCGEGLAVISVEDRQARFLDREP